MDVAESQSAVSVLRPLSGLPAWPRKLVRGVNHRLGSLYQNLHVIFGLAARQPFQPSEEVSSVGLSLLEMLAERQHGSGDPVSLSRVRSALAECSDLRALSFVTNRDGYNVAQAAVIQGDMDFLEVLVSEGVDLNLGRCGLPLHLACKLGNEAMVRFLLSHGARPNIETGMCYPQAHTPVRHVPSRFHFLETDIYTCDSNLLLPVMFAIESDNLAIVRVLMETDTSSLGWPIQRLPLHHACKHGAYECMRYLASQRPKDIQERDLEGKVPLLHAVQWGKPFAKYLVETEAQVHLLSSKQRTALHELFLHIQDPFQLYQTTQFLLGSGLEQYTNHVDCDRNTPLHILISLVNCLVKSFLPPTEWTVESLARKQRQFDEQVLGTIELLLLHNCDANVISNSGVSALHKLLLTFDFVVSNDPTGITLETLPVREKYKVDFSLLQAAMLKLLEHGADPNLVTGAGRTPLVMLLHTMLDVDTEHLADYQSGFAQAVELLCHYGAQPSLSVQSHVVTVITLCKFGHKCLLQRDAAVQEVMADLLLEVLTVLLRFGLDSNYCSLDSKRDRGEGDGGNLLVELVKLSACVSAPRDLEHVYKWILRTLQWGADPDLEACPSEPIICTSQSSIYLKATGGQPMTHMMSHIQDSSSLSLDPHTLRVLLLFYHSMAQGPLYKCLISAKVMSRFDPLCVRTPSSNFLQLVQHLTSQPRTLKQLARVAIFQAIHRKLTLAIPCLPLPQALLDYLLYIE